MLETRIRGELLTKTVRCYSAGPARYFATTCLLSDEEPGNKNRFFRSNHSFSCSSFHSIHLENLSLDLQKCRTFVNTGEINISLVF